MVPSYILIFKLKFNFCPGQWNPMYFHLYSTFSSMCISHKTPKMPSNARFVSFYQIEKCTARLLTFSLISYICFFIMQEWKVLPAHIWQNESIFPACHYHKIYRVEGVGLKKIYILYFKIQFLNMWISVQFLKKLIFCQYLTVVWNGYLLIFWQKKSYFTSQNVGNLVQIS